MKNDFSNQKELGNELLQENSGDYLTSLAVSEANSIMNSISSIESSLSGIQGAIAAKRAEIEAREKEQEKE